MPHPLMPHMPPSADAQGWDKTFYVLMGANFLAGVVSCEPLSSVDQRGGVEVCMCGWRV